MASLWHGLREVIQLYGEAYFRALERWRTYTSANLVRNRIVLLEQIPALLSRYALDPTLYAIRLIDASGQSVERDDLEQEVSPTYGWNPVPDGDRKTLQIIENSSHLSQEEYHAGGVFLQAELLVQLAGVSEEIRYRSNYANRKQIHTLFHKILHLLENVGSAYITVVHASNPIVPTGYGYNVHQIRSAAGNELYELLSHHSLAQPVAQLGASSPEQRSAEKRLCTGDLTDDTEVTESVAPSFTQPFLASIEPGQVAASHTRAPLKPPVQLSDAAPFGFRQGIAVKHMCDPRNYTGAAAAKQLPFAEASLAALQEDLNVLARNRASAPITAQLDAGSHRAPPVSVVRWTAKHPSVGTSVATRAPASTATAAGVEPTTAARINGTVTGYTAGDNGSAYRVQWERAGHRPSQLSAAEFQEAAALYLRLEGWITTHPSVNRAVAGVYPLRKVPGGGSSQVGAVCRNEQNEVVRIVLSKTKALYFGRVTRYLPASDDRAQDQLYHVQWSDGDREDFDEVQLQKALRLHEQHIQQI
jgi:hypothetical protein